MVLLKLLAQGLVGFARGLTKHVLNYPNSPVPMRKDFFGETDNPKSSQELLFGKHGAGVKQGP